MVILEVETDENPQELVARIRRKLDFYGELEFVAVHDGTQSHPYPERDNNGCMIYQEGGVVDRHRKDEDVSDPEPEPEKTEGENVK